MNANRLISFRCLHAAVLLASIFLVETHQHIYSQTYQWEERTGLTPRPPAGNGAFNAYDTVRQKLMVGYGWMWNGATWNFQSSDGPSGAGGIVFDSARGVLVVHRLTEPGEDGETWLWNGSNWQLVSTNGPNGRVCSMGYDSRRQRVVLFGGEYPVQGLESPETWEWNGTNWAIAAGPTNAPPRRREYAVAYDAARGNLVLFGGSRLPLESLYLADTWIWDGIAWAQKNTPGPKARLGHAMTYDPNRQRVLLFGGYAYDGQSPGAMMNDLWEWDGETWTQLAANSPPVARYYACFTYDERRHQIVLFGGAGVGGNLDFLQDTWVLQTPAVWVDSSYAGTETGGFSQPFNTLAEGINAVPNAGTIRLKSGFLSHNGAISKPLTLFAPFEPATIGN